MDAIDKFIARVSEDTGRGHDEFRELLTSTGLQFDECCNQVALRVARQFDSGDLSYNDGDAAMNVVWAGIVDTLEDSPMPEPAFAIYEAFDAGEPVAPETARTTTPSLCTQSPQSLRSSGSTIRTFRSQLAIPEVPVGGTRRGRRLTSFRVGLRVARPVGWGADHHPMSAPSSRPG